MRPRPTIAGLRAHARVLVLARAPLLPRRGRTTTTHVTARHAGARRRKRRVSAPSCPVLPTSCSPTGRRCGATAGPARPASSSTRPIVHRFALESSSLRPGCGRARQRGRELAGSRPAHRGVARGRPGPDPGAGRFGQDDGARGALPSSRGGAQLRRRERVRARLQPAGRGRDAGAAGRLAARRPAQGPARSTPSATTSFAGPARTCA